MTHDEQRHSMIFEDMSYMSNEAIHPREATTYNTNSDTSIRKGARWRYANVGKIWRLQIHSARSRFPHRVPRIQATQEGHFRASGQIHLWRYNLSMRIRTRTSVRQRSFVRWRSGENTGKIRDKQRSNLIVQFESQWNREKEAQRSQGNFIKARRK